MAVVDSSECQDVVAEVRSILSFFHLREGARVVVVCNKCDLQSAQLPLNFPWPVVHVSCVSATGLHSLVSYFRWFILHTVKPFSMVSNRPCFHKKYFISIR